MIVKGDSRKWVRFYLKSTNAVTGITTPTDLTGCTVEAKYKINGGTQKTETLSVVDDPTDGIVEFQSKIDGSSWDAAGTVEGRIYVSAGGRTGKSWKFYLEVEEE